METILNTESEVTDISQRFQDFTVDDNQFSEHLKNSTAFSMKLKKSKKKLQKFLECHPELPIPIKIRKDARRTDGDEMTELNYRKLG